MGKFFKTAKFYFLISVLITHLYATSENVSECTLKICMYVIVQCCIFKVALVKLPVTTTSSCNTGNQL